jgi:cellulose synthase/poly-beta-1,6-N-acetylglucosamine synthase-like glycosyltransferase
MTRPLTPRVDPNPTCRKGRPAPADVRSGDGAAVRYSVIVPAFNAAEDLGRCLRALAEQTVDRSLYEVVVVDDGSTDNTAAVASAFAESVEAPAVRLVRLPHGGPAAARNRGARAARGDILLFTDADCEPMPDWIAEIARPLESDPNVAAAKGVYQTRQTTLVARFTQLELEEKYARLRSRDSIDFVDTYSAAFRLDAFWSGGAFDPSFPAASNEDTLLSFNLASAGHRLVFAERAVVYHRHAESLRHYLLRKMRHGFYRTRVYRLHPGKIRGDSYTPRSTQLQLAAACLLPLALLAWGIGGSALPALGVTLLFLASTGPFVRRAIPAGPGLTLIVPGILLLRAWSLALGLGAGAISLIRTRRPTIDAAALPGRDTARGSLARARKPQGDVRDASSSR